MHDKTYKMACAPSKDSDQTGRLPGLIRVFTVRTKKSWVLSYPLSAQQKLWSDWADAQADLSLCWTHMPFVGFVMRWFIYKLGTSFDKDLYQPVHSVWSEFSLFMSTELLDTV